MQSKQCGEALQDEREAEIGKGRPAGQQIAVRGRGRYDGRADLSDSATMARANAELHRAVWHAGRNQSLIDLLDRLSMHLGRYPSTTLAYPGRWKQALQEHREIIKAIESRDGERAAELARDHFQAARDVRLMLWRARGD